MHEHLMTEKSLKFPRHFIDAILKSDSGITTRLFDEKHISAEDQLSFLDKETGACFAEVEVTRIEEKPFSEVMKDAVDLKGMYQQYEAYYQRTVEPSTPVKIISYRIRKKFPPS
jgi:hypothetical protein